MLLLASKLNDLTYVTLPDGRMGTVMVTKIVRGKVWLGYSFPEDVEIVRGNAKKKGKEAKK